jgi:hypothetical protein
LTDILWRRFWRLLFPFIVLFARQTAAADVGAFLLRRMSPHLAKAAHFARCGNSAAIWYTFVIPTWSKGQP